MKTDALNLAHSKGRGGHKVGRGMFLRFFELAASLNRTGMSVLRIGLVIVLVWIGALKFANYEADSIVPLVANSPLMSFFYRYPAPGYHAHMNREGELVPAHRAWQIENGTYTFSHFLGFIIVTLGLLIATHRFLPQVAVVGSALVVLMACTTLSFLVTTPEAWVPPIGDSAHGFPYLSGVGRLIVKDAIMFGAAITTMADSAKCYLRRIGELR
jgi:reactive chlorine resistance protein C